ncbi:MAG TPA: hypothetical protein VHZ03_35805 [Trebonia sp.]|jgi:hypothetical protein|nr:hypothetical protein [Trebonia sp.]
MTNQAIAGAAIQDRRVTGTVAVPDVTIRTAAHCSRSRSLPSM